ncbi:MAG: ATP-grasp domain-containing protein [Eubacteriaceae bacterium]|nr:ATP-grasp domain-containing protein [Eubacteriaceae bacterium]
MKKNVLILSAGRRVELLEAFRGELKKRFPCGFVYAVDLNPALSAACQVADGNFAVPRVTDVEYVDILLELCLKNDIGIVIPTIDTELFPLSMVKKRFEENGIYLIISSLEVIRLCRDKRKTANLFRDIGVFYPEIYPREAIRYPCFAKPYDGSCSVGASIVQSPDQLTQSMYQDDKIIFQQLIGKDFIEYTVDAYYDATGLLCCLVPRERIEVRAGEVNKGATRKNKLYDYLLPRLSLLKGFMGCVTFQFFANIQEEIYYALEINPRFGGGYPLSYSAGANYPGWLIDEYYMGRNVGFYDDWTANMLMLRYDAKVIVNG